MNSELGGRIDAAISLLPEDLRVAVILRDVQGLSNQEAADSLEVSVSALKARLHRGRIQLRDSLEQYVKERATRNSVYRGADCHADPPPTVTLNLIQYHVCTATIV